MNFDTFPLLLISGPIGAGKSTVGQEISNLLDRQGVAHTFVDLDALAQTYPRPADDPYGSRLARKNLQAVWASAVAAGARNLIVARVVETGDEAAAIAAAAPGAVPTICRLRASDATLTARVRGRELGVGQAWHAARALELARSMDATAPADFVVETDGRSVTDIAQEIAGRVDWELS